MLAEFSSTPLLEFVTYCFTKQNLLPMSHVIAVLPCCAVDVEQLLGIDL